MRLRTLVSYAALGKIGCLRTIGFRKAKLGSWNAQGLPPWLLSLSTLVMGSSRVLISDVIFEVRQP